MTPVAKLAAYVVVLGVVVGGGAAVGNAVGPIDDTADEPAAHDEAHDPGTEADPEAATHESGATDTEHEDEQTRPGGVLVADQGYRLEADQTILAAGSAQLFTFRITGPNGAPVHGFVADHERELHLIVVGSDLGTYAHLHPERAADGTWGIELPALAPGTYRAFADFAVADGPELTLGVDLAVPGTATFAALPSPNPTATVDGYEVTIAGAPEAGATSEVELTVTKDGRPVTDLEPYLGAFGHLVAIRGGDLAYLHVHPVGEAVHDGSARGGPSVRFALEVPSSGDYRLFFDFSHGDAVHTAAFTVEVP
jgi:hypothetical protein